jgi:Tol biopolymer transport system component
MPLSAGTRLGPYEIQSALGAGGMGQVYRARDTRLDRSVAIKILAPEIAADPAARSRFEREARAVAALDHPHICGLHDVGESDGTHYLVMPLVEGQTLAARLEKGPLPIDQALTIATQIADALDKAHRQGIVHRDLKPANIMLTKGGGSSTSSPQAKLLDFGLAKLRPPGGPISMSGIERAETTSGTAHGTILGTVLYMAPEQVEGRDADARADIWALGAVIYEMVTGARPFNGDSAASVIGAILKDTPPPLSARQPLAPAALDHVVSRCLAKDPDDRWQTARDLLHELTWASRREPSEAGRAAPAQRGHVPGWRLAAVAIAAAAATAVVMTLRRPGASVPTRDVRFSIYPEHGTAFAPIEASVVAPQFALSPDGHALAFVATAQGQASLWVRPVAAFSARELPGTEGAGLPFWSPDGQSVAFFAQGRLKIVRLDGGPAVVVTDASLDPRGGTWAQDGTLLASLASNGGISRVTLDGRNELLAPLDRERGETGLRWPAWVADSRHFVALSRNLDESRRGLFLFALDRPARSLLVNSDFGATPTDGRLLYLSGSTLMAQPLDVGQGRLTGEPIPIVDRVGSTSNGYSAFSVSSTGTLANTAPWPAHGELVWFDRGGRRMGEPAAPLADYVDLSMSRDGRVAVSRVDPQTNTGDIWVLDLDRRSETRLTADRFNDAGPLWSADGTRIYFRSNRRGVNGIFVKPANASRPEEMVFELVGESTASVISGSLAPDGSRLLYSTFGLRSSWDLWELALGPSPQATAILDSQFNEYQASYSPDGRWIAFVSNEAGPRQVYVQSHPDGGGRQAVSSRGGSDPVWRADGREIFFIGADRTMTAAPFEGGKVGVAVPLFRTRVPIVGNPYRLPYAVSADGSRFLVNTAPDEVPPPAIHVVLDWRVLLDNRRGAAAR